MRGRARATRALAGSSQSASSTAITPTSARHSLVGREARPTRSVPGGSLNFLWQIHVSASEGPGVGTTAPCAARRRRANCGTRPRPDRGSADKPGCAATLRRPGPSARKPRRSRDSSPTRRSVAGAPVLPTQRNRDRRRGNLRRYAYEARGVRARAAAHSMRA
jgi:hypothetical protein